MPPKRPATTGPSYEEWLSNQEIIFRAWFGGMALDPVLIDHMKREYQFTASKGQYERKFAEWGWKKNLSSADLQYVLARIREREATGKKSIATLQVGAFRMMIPAERLRKGKYRPRKVDANDIVPNKEGISVHTPPANQDDMMAIRYTLSHPNDGIVTLTASEPFSARGKANKRRRIRSSSPVGVIVNAQRHLALVVRKINTQNLPIFRFLEFIESPARYQGMMAYEQPSSYSDVSIYDMGGNDDDLGIGILNDTPSISFSIPTIPETFIYAFFTPYDLHSGPPNKTELRITLLKNLGLSVLERYDGDVESCISRLLGPNDTDTFFEFLVFVMHSGANNEITDMYSIENIMSWLLRQSSRLLKVIFELPFATVHAFFDFVILRSTDSHSHSCPRPGAKFKQTLEGDGAKALLDLDTQHRLFAGNLQRKLEVAILLSHVGLVGRLLEQGVNPNLGSREELASPLEQACNNGDFRLVQQLVKSGADLNPSMLVSGHHHKFPVPFQWALQQGERGEAQVLRYFVERGARPAAGAQVHTNKLQVYRILREGNIETRFEPDWHDFMIVVMEGNEDDVTEYVAAGVDINNNLSLKVFGEFPRGNFESPVFQQLSFNCTALQAAIENRHLGVVKILVENNVDVNAAIYSRHGWSALEIAHALRQTDIIAELLQHEAVFNSTIAAQRTLVEVYHAFHNKDVQTIQKLFQEHEISYLDLLDLAWEHTLETIRSDRGHVHIRREAVQMIRGQSGGDINVIGPRTQRSILELAVRLGDLEYAIHLFSVGARVKVDNTHRPPTLLQSVAKHAQRGTDCSKLIDAMLKSGALADEPDICKGYDAFKTAIWAGIHEDVINLEPAKLILEAGVNVNARPLCRPEKMFVWWAVYHGSGLSEDHSPLQILIHAYSMWPGRWLERSKVNAIAPMVEYLVTHGADINASPSEVQASGTPLQLAIPIYSRNPQIGLDILHLLIQLGADVNSSPGDFGQTALQRAVGHSALVEFLLENGANVNAPAAKMNGRTALQMAAEWGYIKMVKRFLELGADPNAARAEVDGFTALEAAGKAGHLDTVILLLDNGAIATEKAARAAQDSNFFVIARIIIERIGGVSTGSYVEAGLADLEGNISGI